MHSHSRIYIARTISDCKFCVLSTVTVKKPTADVSCVSISSGLVQKICSRATFPFTLMCTGVVQVLRQRRPKRKSPSPIRRPLATNVAYNEIGSASFCRSAVCMMPVVRMRMTTVERLTLHQMLTIQTMCAFLLVQADISHLIACLSLLRPRGRSLCVPHISEESANPCANP